MSVLVYLSKPKKVQKSHLLVMLCFILFAVNVFSQNPLEAPFQTIDSLLAQEYSSQQPGIAVLAAVGDEIVFKKSYGLADLDEQESLSTDVVFEIGSMTKQFTSASILQLVEKGEVRLDDPIQKYIEFFPSKIYPITIHHLLSQTSGLPEFFDVDEDEFAILNQQHSPEELINYYKDLPLNFEPGTQFQYSNSNYPLLGLVIERVTGMPLKDYFEQHIFGPLGMNNTSLWYQEDEDDLRAQGYRFNSENELVKSPPIDGSTVYAAGGIVSTLDDLLKWNNELRLPRHLSRRIVKQLWKEKKTSDNRPTGYGYGFYIEELQEYQVIQHGGYMYGFTSTALYLPKKDVYVCVLANRSFENTKNIARYIASCLIDEPIELYRRLAPGKITEYTGRYELQNPKGRVLEVRVYEGNLVLYFPDTPGTEVLLYNTGGDTFRSPNISFRLDFKRSEKGAVSGFTVYQQGEYEWVRL